MMFKFKPDDFKGSYYHNQQILESFARRANELLQKEIASWPMVYGKATDENRGWTLEKYSTDTHQALLAFIEPIVKEECKHEPQAYCSAMFGQHKCRHCGVELVVAEWKAK